MKKTILKVVAAMAEKGIAKSSNTVCYFLSYQPKAPANIKKFKK